METKVVNSKFKGISQATIAYIAFGLLPLFTKPVTATGMPQQSVLVYQFAVATLAMLIVLLFKRESLKVRLGDLLQILILSVLYAGSSTGIIAGYNYMSVGIATTLFFSFPVWTALIMVIFFRERLRPMMVMAIIIAVVGVCFLCGIGAGGKFSVTGLVIELSAGLSFAIYMVAMPRMPIIKLNGFKVTFYVFLMSTILLIPYSLGTTGTIQPISTGGQAVNLILLGIIPTTLSNMNVNLSLKNISSTMVSILGAFEPLTAMVVSILVFGELFTAGIGTGMVLIIIAVIILITSAAKNNK